MADEVNLNSYFERIGFAGSIAPNLQTLQALQLAHLMAIPFENLNPLLGLAVPLDLKSLEQKLIKERRGGYCFEQNGLFLAVLRTLGFEATGHAARVVWGQAPDANTPLSHMMISVDMGGQKYLTDVGFGTSVPTGPLRIRTDTEQETPHETYRLTGGDPVYLLEMKTGEEWRPCYRFDMSEQHPIDYQVYNWHVSTHPDSAFRHELRVAKPGKGERLALRNTEFSVHPTGGETEKRTLGSVSEIKETLTQSFGLNLPSAELLDPVLERIVAEGALMAPVIVNPDNVREFKTAAAFERWLKSNHDKAAEVWIKIHKKDSGLASITALEAIDVVLCWGWIDAIRKSHDKDSFLQRYVPRGKKSVWSQINRDNVARLVTEGRMTAFGLVQVDAAKADGRWDRAYASAKSGDMPDDLIAAIEAEPAALDMYRTLSSQNRFALGFRVHNMKTAVGREKKIASFVEMLKRGETIYPQKAKA